MLLAAADTVAESVDASRPGASVMPAVEEVRAVSLRVAVAVARAAEAEGLARADVSDVAAQVRSAMWGPAYRVVRPPTSDGGGVARR
jgi:malate dehydrogenase (oxaloacetate-decarboxylating)